LRRVGIFGIPFLVARCGGKTEVVIDEIIEGVLEGVGLYLFVKKDRNELSLREDGLEFGHGILNLDRLSGMLVDFHGNIPLIC
jgi:hypothetical protein